MTLGTRIHRLFAWKGGSPSVSLQTTRVFNMASYVLVNCTRSAAVVIFLCLYLFCSHICVASSVRGVALTSKYLSLEFNKIFD